MYLENAKRKPTVIIIFFCLMEVILWYLGFICDFFPALILFYCGLMLGLILLSKYSCEKMIKMKWEKLSLIQHNKAYIPQKIKMIRYVILIASPFYLLWFLITFLSCLNAYFFVILNFPILTLSFLSFLFLFDLWKELEGNKSLFWGLHIVCFLLIQGLGWLVRHVWLAELYLYR